MNNTLHTDTGGALVLSYLDLRKAVGLIGLLLPFVLALGKLLLEGPGLQSSVSAYYHTVMGDVFVGSMCAMAVFFVSYRGYEDKDALAGDLACLFALGIALFPVAPQPAPSASQQMIGAVHLVSAVCFFLTLAYFALVLFRKTDPSREPTPRKLMRNRVYTVCGYAILACLALAVLTKLLRWDHMYPQLAPVFWLEASAIVAFGLSWFVKGEGILEDVAH